MSNLEWEYYGIEFAKKQNWVLIPCDKVKSEFVVIFVVLIL